MTVSLINYTDTSLFTVEDQERLAHVTDILESKLIISEQPALTAPNLVKAFCQTLLASKEHKVFAVIFPITNIEFALLQNSSPAPWISFRLFSRSG
ncbi:hypothetical protein [Vibrio mediterranei]|uniref:hypothetical protein n=1 Tax=Vibrio mediterranei TaxID=689 RepID=UPI001F0CB397|nr:hypothetical protein [Vibrio mediterranei]